MREVAEAIREGAWAYLMRQFKALLPPGLPADRHPLGSRPRSPAAVASGRAAAFFMGAIFSWLVGFVGMSLAVRGNLRVAAAARTSYGNGPAARLPHRHDHRHAHRRPGPAGRLDHLHDLRRARLRSPAGLRLRRHAAGPVHARRRRHLHQGGRRRRRPGRQGRGRTSPKTIRATPPPSPTTSATTSATAPVWPPTSSRATKSPSSRP